MWCKTMPFWCIAVFFHIASVAVLFYYYLYTLKTLCLSCFFLNLFYLFIIRPLKKPNVNSNYAIHSHLRPSLALYYKTSKTAKRNFMKLPHITYHMLLFTPFIFFAWITMEVTWCKTRSRPSTNQNYFWGYLCVF